jgi:hypothetical protein
MLASLVRIFSWLHRGLCRNAVGEAYQELSYQREREEAEHAIGKGLIREMQGLMQIQAVARVRRYVQICCLR